MDVRVGIGEPDHAEYRLWRMRIYIDAAEAGASLSTLRRRGATKRESESERSADEAACRARGQIRRYCASNRLNRLGMLTYAGEGCHDAQVLRSDVGGFFRRMRRELGSDRFPYLWVPEWHPGGHVHIKLLGELPAGSGDLAEARLAAGYLAKYAGKAMEDDRPPGLHRYEVAQDFAPLSVTCERETVEEVIETASIVMGSEPTRVWHSFSRPETSGYEGSAERGRSRAPPGDRQADAPE